jgi:hypothetical protein
VGDFDIVDPFELELVPVDPVALGVPIPVPPCPLEPPPAPAPPLPPDPCAKAPPANASSIAEQTTALLMSLMIASLNNARLDLTCSPAAHERTRVPMSVGATDRRPAELTVVSHLIPWLGSPRPEQKLYPRRHQCVCQCSLQEKMRIFIRARRSATAASRNAAAPASMRPLVRLSVTARV